VGSAGSVPGSAASPSGLSSPQSTPASESSSTPERKDAKEAEIAKQREQIRIRDKTIADLTASLEKVQKTLNGEYEKKEEHIGRVLAETRAVRDDLRAARAEIDRLKGGKSSENRTPSVSECKSVSADGKPVSTDGKPALGEKPTSDGELAPESKLVSVDGKPTPADKKPTAEEPTTTGKSSVTEGKSGATEGKSGATEGKFSAPEEKAAGTAGALHKNESLVGESKPSSSSSPRDEDNAGTSMQLGSTPKIGKQHGSLDLEIDLARLKGVGEILGEL
jgi:hypothetical protein